MFAKLSLKTKLVLLLVMSVIGMVLLTGCDFDVYELPLPGGADTGKDPIQITVRFDDVDLPRDDLAAYQTHPQHVEAAGFIKSVVSGRSCVDYEF